MQIEASVRHRMGHLKGERGMTKCCLHSLDNIVAENDRRNWVTRRIPLCIKQQQQQKHLSFLVSEIGNEFSTLKLSFIWNITKIPNPNHDKIFHFLHGNSALC